MPLKAFYKLREKLSKPSAELLCQDIWLTAPQSDLESALVKGPGRLTFREDGQIRFEVQASLSNAQSSLLHMNHGRYGFRFGGLHLHGETYDGMEFQAWIEGVRCAHESIFNRTNVLIAGRVSCLMTRVAVPKGPAKAVAIYAHPPSVQLTTWRRTEVSHGDKTEQVRQEAAGHSFETGGTEVTVLLNREANELEVSAKVGVGNFTHPNLEHILTEPFRALHGAAYYPRYLLRDFGDETAQLQILPWSKHGASLGGACSTFGLIEPDGYWSYFGKYLDYLAVNYDPNFFADPNKVTLFHDEVIRAVRGGSHWIISLALSSAIEGLCKMHPAWSKHPSPVSPAEKEAVEAFLQTLPSQFLKDKINSALKGACAEQQPQGSSVLKLLMEEGVIESRHKKAWERFRHFVAHGNLLDHREPDSRLSVFEDLYELFQLLTANRIGFSTADHPLSDGGREMLESYRGARHAD